MPFNWVPNQDTAVYTMDGHLVGQVAEAWPSEYTSSKALANAVGEQGTGYFRMTGFKGGDLFIPTSAMADYTDERIRLKVTKGALGKQGWNTRPSAPTGD